MKHSILVPFSFLLFTFIGCDYADRRVTDGERADRLYQAAMEEYAAGRLDKSIAAFEKVLRSNPGNASARFQLACLLQDHRKDPLGAICNYREYAALCPKGDKVRIATERSAACERMLATALVKKYDLGGSVAQDEANQRLKADKESLGKALEASRKETEKLHGELDALRRENERVRRMALTGPSDEAPAAKTTPRMPDEKDLLEEEVGVDRIKLSSDIDNLIVEEQDETSQVSPFGKTVRKPEEPAKAAPAEPPHEPRPKTYVVEEGDTLFKLAVRFYGRRSAWTVIRDANKATVSSDGRIKAGQTLRLP